MTFKKKVLTDKDSPEGFKPKKRPAPPPATESAALKKKNNDRWEAAKRSAKQAPAPEPEVQRPVRDTTKHSAIVAKIEAARARNAAARKIRDDAAAKLPSRCAQVKALVAAQVAKRNDSRLNVVKQGDMNDKADE